MLQLLWYYSLFFTKGGLAVNIRNYKGKNLIAWLWYKENFEDPYGGRENKRCYVYPRFLLKNNTIETVDPDDFPDRGSIEVFIQGGETVEDLYDRVGSLVNIKLNEEPSINNNYSARNRYCLKYNYQFGRNDSEIWIDEFSGKGFYQVIDIFDISSIQSEKSFKAPDSAPYTTLILLRFEDKIFGPFEYDIKDDTVFLQSCKEHDYLIGVYNSDLFNENYLSIKNNDDEEVVLLLPKALLCPPAECEKSYDWITEEKLIDDFFIRLRTSTEYTREQIRQIKDNVLQTLKAKSDGTISEERVERICKLFESVSQEDNRIQQLVQYAMDDDVLKEALIKEIANNHFELIESKLPEYDSVQQEISKLKSEKAKIEDEIRELEESRSTDELPADYSENLENLQNEIEEKNNTITQLKIRIEEYEHRESALGKKEEVESEIAQLCKERDEFRAQRRDAKKEYDRQLLDNEDLKRQFKETLESFNDQAKQTAKILDSKLLDRIIRGLDGDDYEESNIVEFNASLLTSNRMNYDEIINYITTFVTEKAHRDVSTNDIANYLICISQGFITTFAGEPGTGKTSLCNILAKSLGLATDNMQKRFVEISVERGWASHKDYIGYYNPLSKKVEKSNIEVYDAFQKLKYENSKDPSEIAPFFILLDEANLSPIEHYWAAFLRICDFDSVSERSISLGGNECIKLPEYLRFLATVNFDHTTEELSPRFLDRSWVIMLEPSRIDEEIDDNIANAERMISFGDIKKAFSFREDDSIDGPIQDKWITIQKIFKERSLQIMPRNLKMVKRYCAVACRCMERDTPSTRFAPLDYAFSQKILPTINGSGKNYESLIDDLLKECTAQNMPLSNKHLERMKKNATENMGFYQFFSH